MYQILIIFHHQIKKFPFSDRTTLSNLQQPYETVVIRDEIEAKNNFFFNYQSVFVGFMIRKSDFDLFLKKISSKKIVFI